MQFTSTFTLNFVMLIAIALIVSSLGFYKYVYFISLGYGFSIAVMGLAMFMLFKGQMTSVTLLLCFLLMCYGLRLGGYLLIRESRSLSYRQCMKEEIKDGKEMKLGIKISIWVSCSLLYCLQVSPIFFLLQNDRKPGLMAHVGVIVMILGMTLEALADYQKTKAKKIAPKRFCDQGLFKLVRCPNYLGEILFWTGVLLAGSTSMQGIWQWLAALIGYLCIVYIMFGGARRLEIRQNKNYGADPAYQAYVKKTPIILPFIPLYSVEKYKWLVG